MKRVFRAICCLHHHSLGHAVDLLNPALDRSYRECRGTEHHEQGTKNRQLAHFLSPSIIEFFALGGHSRGRSLPFESNRPFVKIHR
jgi:hypothetical protein